MKTAAWAIPTKKERVSFEGLLETLFKAQEDLRIAVDETFASANVKIMVVRHGVIFNQDLMDNACSPSSISQNPVKNEVAGTVGIGVVKAENLELGSPNKCLAMRTRIVLESDLQAALRGKFPTENQVLTNEVINNTDGRG